MFEHQGYNAMKADIWACGVILFIMFAGFPPFQSPKTTDWFSFFVFSLVAQLFFEFLVVNGLFRWFHKLKNNRHDLFWRAHCRTVATRDMFLYGMLGLGVLLGHLQGPH